MAKTNLLSAAPTIVVLAIFASVAAFGSPYLTTVAGLIVINAIAASGLSLFTGYAGQFSLGHAALMGVGAYGAAITARDLGLPPLLSIAAGVVLASVIGLLVGLPTVRLAGYYLAIATYGLGVILYVVFQEGGAFTGGAQGLLGIPALEVFGVDLSSDSRAFFVASAFVLLLCVAMIHATISSNYGRGLRTIATSEASAAAMGVGVNRVKLEVFVISSAMAGLAGGLYAYSVRFIDPSAFSPAISIWLLVMVALGGAGTLWGPLIGAALFIGLREVLKQVLPAIAPETGTRVETLFFGVVLILVLIFPPNKLWHGVGDRLRDGLNAERRPVERKVGA